ncbi:uncharacterized protein LOC124163945 [Ischnura elegans]|uniref:uncharacterized protein LOC124163945 n=1 Tax=Ischnura elegans TaxID=197161 RepID=UPI001ED8A718|nr:uncharacterized protein LOC124163945 [Ischnura elegans]
MVIMEQMEEDMSESQENQATMSNLSPATSRSESDSEYETVDVDEFLRRDKDEKWASFLEEEEEPEPKPYISLIERARIMEEKDRERMKATLARGPMRLPADYVPPPKPPPVNEAEAKAARYKAWKEKIQRIQREAQALFEENLRNKRAEYEMYAKLQKEYYPRDYYWKPDPLHYLHLKELGYSKIAIEKALFYTDNVSVAKAIEYLKKNPNPTELTKQEVMAAGEQVLKRIRPKRRDRLNQDEQALSRESEMEIEDSQPLSPPNDSHADGAPSEETGEEEKMHREVVFAQPRPPSKKNKGKSRRGVKRTHAGDIVVQPAQQSTSKKVHQPTSTEIHAPRPKTTKVHFHPSTKFHTEQPTPVAPPIPVEEEKLQIKMIFIVNASLLMDAVTLALEVGKVVANITSKLNADNGKYKNMYDEWTCEGHKMWMFRGENNQFLTQEYELMSHQDVIAYLAQCTHYRDMKTPSPTVLGVFGDSHQLRRCNNLPIL